jgi:aquaporin Z
MNKYLTEFIGTFFLVLAITLSVITGQPLAAVAIGGMLMVMIYMGGHISGAHYNPAVTLAAVMRGALPGSQLIPYWISQIAGGIVAALLGNFLAKGYCDNLIAQGQSATCAVPIAPGAGVGVVAALLLEILFTFALALVVLNVATAHGTKGNSFYGLAIGFTVVAGAIAAGGLSGGAFNPAVGIGLSLGALLAGVGGGSMWIYILGPLAGGALAALVFNMQGNEDIH